jgi:hypothetical protein
LFWRVRRSKLPSEVVAPLPLRPRPSRWRGTVYLIFHNGPLRAVRLVDCGRVMHAEMTVRSGPACSLVKAAGR